MKPRTLLVALLVATGTATCWRLAAWQLARRAEKHAINQTLDAALAGPARDFGAIPDDSLVGRKLRLRGHYDPRFHLLLTARDHGDLPGVEVVTPFVLTDSTAVLVDRGWMYAEDAATVLPDSIPADAAGTVIGFAEPFDASGRAAPLREVAGAPVRVWGAARLHRDSLRARLPYRLARCVLRVLPGPGVPARPLAVEPLRRDELVHLSYAIQWFLFGSILLFGSIALAIQRGRAARSRAR